MTHGNRVGADHPKRMKTGNVTYVANLMKLPYSASFFYCHSIDEAIPDHFLQLAVGWLVAGSGASAPASCPANEAKTEDNLHANSPAHSHFHTTDRESRSGFRHLSPGHCHRWPTLFFVDLRGGNSAHSSGNRLRNCLTP
jgi:hypothetical protein